MNTGKKSNTVELEVLALLFGLLVIVCAVTAVIKGGAVLHTCLTIMAAAGGIMNLTIAMLKWKRGGKKQSIFFSLMAVLLLAAVVMLQIYR